MLVTFLFESRREEELTKAGEIRLTAVLEGLGKLLDHLLLLLINVHIGGIQQSTNESENMYKFSRVIKELRSRQEEQVCCVHTITMI